MRRRNFSSGAPWEEAVGYSRAVRQDGRIWVSGTTGTDERGRVVEPGDAYAQAKRAIAKIEKALKKVQAKLSDVVRTRVYTTDISRWKEIGRAHGEAFGKIRPACAMVEVRRLIDPKMLVEIEAEASLGGRGEVETVFFRKGRGSDLPLIRRKAKAWRLDDERLAAGQFLVAEDGGGRVVGFGRVKPYRFCYELGTVGVEPSWRGRGVGEAIVRRLVRDFPARKVWITTDLVDHFRKLGFREADRGPKELQEKVACTCRVKGRPGCQIMFRTKP